MSRSLTYTFPPGNATAVCAEQTLGGVVALVLNGSLANSTWSAVDFLSHGYSRSLSFTSAQVVNRTFTITGFQNGVPITEVLNKPDATTVYSVQIYDVVTSISVSGAINGISVGTGFAGFFPLIEINLERDVINYTLSTAKKTPASIDTVVYGTIANIYQNGHTFLDSATNDFNIFTIQESAAVDNFIYPATGVANTALDRFLLIRIDGGIGDIANSIELNFIQT